MAFYDDSSLLRNHEVPLDVSETWEEEERFYRLGREHAPALLREVRISFDDGTLNTYTSNLTMLLTLQRGRFLHNLQQQCRTLRGIDCAE